MDAVGARRVSAKEGANPSAPQLRQNRFGCFGETCPPSHCCQLGHALMRLPCLISATPAVPAGVPGRQLRAGGWRRRGPFFSSPVRYFGFSPTDLAEESIYEICCRRKSNQPACNCCCRNSLGVRPTFFLKKVLKVAFELKPADSMISSMVSSRLAGSASKRLHSSTR